MLALTISNSTYASLIEINGYGLDTDTNIVTMGNTEWLKWDQTVDLTVEQALEANVGWSLASHMQIEVLLNDMVGSEYFKLGEDTDESYGLDYGQDDSPMLNIIQLFGYNSESRTRYGNDWKEEYTDPYKYVGALFGSDKDMDDLNLVALHDEAAYTITGSYNASRTFGGSITKTSDRIARDSSYHVWGVALVRTTSVPEPSTLAIFALGVIGLASRRFKKQS